MMDKHAGGKRGVRSLARLDTSLVEYPRQPSNRALLRGGVDGSSESDSGPDQPETERKIW